MRPAGVALSLVLVSAVVVVSAERPTPDGALARLKAGNAAFVEDSGPRPTVGPARRKGLVAGQHPFAILLSCADSRVPPEYVFNAGLGDLFVVRAAGQMADRSVIASVEYAAEHLDVPLLAVLGHESCGAVKAASESTGTSLGPNLDYLVKAIRPSVDAARSVADEQRLKTAILNNVEQVVNDVLGRSAILRERVEKGQLGVVGGYYELGSGRVTFSRPVAPSEVAALAHGMR